MTHIKLTEKVKTIEDLYIAIEKDDKEKVQNVVSSGGLDLNNAYKDTLSPLSFSICKNCSTDVINVLIKAGADIDFGFDCELMKVDKDTNALVLSCIYKQYDCFNLLVEAGGNVDVRDHKGRPLLHLACRNDPRYAKILLRNGVDQHAVCLNKNNALHAAVSANSHIETFQVLLKYGVNPSLRNGQSLSAEEQALGQSGLAMIIQGMLTKYIKDKKKGVLKRKIDNTALDDNKLKLQRAEKKFKTADHNYRMLSKKIDAAKENRKQVSKTCIKIRKEIARVIDTDNSIFNQSLECPICFVDYAPDTHILQCTYGHLLCGICFESPTMTHCPQCRNPFINGHYCRNRVLEDIVTHLRSY